MEPGSRTLMDGHAVAERERHVPGSTAVAKHLVDRTATTLSLVLATITTIALAATAPEWVWLSVVPFVVVAVGSRKPEHTRLRAVLGFESAWGIIGVVAAGPPAAALLIIPAATAGAATFAQHVRAPDGKPAASLAMTDAALSLLGPLVYLIWSGVQGRESGAPIAVCIAAISFAAAPAIWAVLVSALELDLTIRRLARPSAIARASSRLHDPVREAGFALQSAARTAAEGGASQEAIAQLHVLDGRIDEILGSLARTWVKWGRPAIRAGIPERAIGWMTSRFGRSMKAWTTIDATPEWWPIGFRRSWASRVAPVLDTIRLLHTPRIEVLALHVTLWLRALFVVGAPALGGVLLGGVVPTGDGRHWWENACWGVAAAAAALTASASQAVVRRVMEPEATRFRRGLFAVEQSILLAGLVGAPSWAMFAFAAGPHNWTQRPEWRVRRVVLLAVVNVAVLATSLAVRGESARSIVAQVLVAGAVVLAISNSYGLMFPFVVYSALARPLLARARRERLEDALVDPRVRAAKGELDAAEAVIRAEVEHGRLATEAGGEAISGIRAARQSVRAAGEEPRRRPPRTLAAIFHEAITARIPMTSFSGGAHIQATQTSFVPADLGEWRVRSRKAASTLDQVLGSIAAEAELHGVGLFQTVCRQHGDVIEVTAANDIDPARRDESGHEVGATSIRENVEALPGGALAMRQISDGSVIDEPSTITVFAVRFTFSSDRALQPPS